MEWTRWFRRLVVMSLVLWFVMTVVTPVSGFPPKGTPIPSRPYGAVPPVSVMPYNSLAEVISEDRWSDVHDKPCGPTIRFSVLTGTKARVAEHMWACGDVWYRVEFANGKQGWLPWSMLNYLGR